MLPHHPSPTSTNATDNEAAEIRQKQSLLHDPFEKDQECIASLSATVPANDRLTTPLLLPEGKCTVPLHSSIHDTNNCNEYDDDDEYDNFDHVSVSYSLPSVDVAAIFLTDYENSRPCSLPTNIAQIQSIHVKIHRIRHSLLWQCILYTAVGCLFLESCLDGGPRSDHRDWAQFVLTLVSAFVLSVDVFMTSARSNSTGSRNPNTGGVQRQQQQQHNAYSILEEMENQNMEMYHLEEEEQEEDGDGNNDDDNNHDDSSTFHNDASQQLDDPCSIPKRRKRGARHWKMPLLWMLLVLTLETWMKMMVPRKTFVWTGCFKPIVFFYASSKARDALTALYYVSRIVFRVIFIELFLLLSFAAMACHLYFCFESYRDLPTSFLSLFEIQTTAATPGLWIPVYDQDRSSAIFFVLFLIICVFFVHSVVLSVVFQTYIHSMKILRERAAVDRQESMKLAFLALKPVNFDIGMEDDGDDRHELSVETAKVRKVIQTLRPHYSSEKIDVLVQIVDPNRNGMIEYNDFRARMPIVLRTSLRSARSASRHSMVLSSVNVGVAILNMFYVLLFSSSPLEFVLLSNLIFPMGTIITLVGLLEVMARLRPCAFLNSLSTVRHGVLDALAMIAGIVSMIGILSHTMKDTKGLQWLLLGRAIDMIRVMRLSSIFRSLVKRSGEVLPAIVGPLALVLTSLHFFTYTGMAIWGGAISVGTHKDKVTPLYDLNNFNDYPSGLLTMFNIFVVNDWQTIAGVYLTADRFSSPYIVYPFFIGANLIGVNIFLNVLTAFFVGAFVTKVEKKNLGRRDNLQLSMSMRLDAFHDNIMVNSNNEQGDSTPSFHILERRGYDNVISTITGDEASDIVTKACGILQTFESLVPLEKRIGYLIAYHECKDYIVNPCFLGIVKGFIKHDDDLQAVVSEIFRNLSEKEFGYQVKKEYYDYGGCRKLDLTSSFCSQSPTMLLIVATSNVVENIE